MKKMPELLHAAGSLTDSFSTVVMVMGMINTIQTLASGDVT